MIDSIYSSKVTVKKSTIHGDGAFCVEKINKGEIVFVKNGHILTKEEKCSKSVIDCYWPIDDLYVLGAKEETECDRVKLFINHSCDPNCGLVGLNVGIAMRDINIGEEITFDYAMLDNEDYVFNCSCGSEFCRKIITGFDWKKPYLQSKYKGYFVNYLQEKIDKEY